MTLIEMASSGSCQNEDNSQANFNYRRSIKEGNKDFIPVFVLLEACQSNNEKIVKDLVRKMSCLSSADVGPLVNFQDQTGRTPLSFASCIGNIVLIEELSKLRRLDPNLADNDGNAPLHFASQAGHSTVVDLLLSRFEGVIDPNCRNSTGLTPLMKAALQGRSRVAKSLIIAGASPLLRDYSRNLTAAEWARLCGRHICAEVIIRCAKDNFCSSPSSSKSFNSHKALSCSQSSQELKRMNSDESPYYQLQHVRNTISGATWLKNKIKRVLGASESTGSSVSGRNFETPSSSHRLVSHLSGATLCAGSLILPSIKPLLEQSKPKTCKKHNIPTVQVTPVMR